MTIFYLGGMVFVETNPDAVWSTRCLYFIKFLELISAPGDNPPDLTTLSLPDKGRLSSLMFQHPLFYPCKILPSFVLPRAFYGNFGMGEGGGAK